MIDKGVTTFMILATSLVMLMTPGLSFFYGGLGNKKNILNIMMQSFVSLGLTTVLWFSFGYSLCFSGALADGTDMWGIIGNLDKAFLSGITPKTMMVGKAFPEYVFFAYQMMFAIITPALITGAIINRVTFKSFVFFLIFWQIFVYYPFVHMIWGGGILQQWGVLDFAGGIVVHATAGFAALTWLLIEWNTGKMKPTFIGLMTGAVAGLATITPAAGYVTVGAAACIGTMSGIVCYLAVEFKNRMKWDDALDVWGVHGVGGIFGTILLGIFATTTINPGTINGLFYGGGFELIAKEVVALLFAIVWASSFTWIMLHAINRYVPVKVTDAIQKSGLDLHMHGEVARVI